MRGLKIKSCANFFSVFEVFLMAIRGDLLYDSTDLIQNHAGLTTIPDGLSEILRYLDLSFNNISVIPADSFTNLTRCRSLFISYNRIHTIEANAFRGLKKLQYLHLGR